MRLPSAHADRRRPDVIMTPMIDVVFLLLIFFVCTASFQIAEEMLPTNLTAFGATAPTDVLPPELDLDRVVVKLRLHAQQPTWLVNDRPLDSLSRVAQLLREVAEIDPAVPVILDCEGQVPLGQVIDVYDLCRQVGFDKIQFAASFSDGESFSPGRQAGSD